MTGTLITNNANFHPPETWAQATASRILDVGQDVPADRRIPAMALQAAIAGALVKHHAQVQTDEQAALDADPERVLAGHDVVNYLDPVVADIQALAVGTPFEAAFSGDDLVERMRAVLASDFATAQHIHRQAHARATGSDQGRAFLAGLGVK